MNDQVQREFLDLLERLEFRLLVWGAVDCGFAEEELHSLAEQFLAERDAAPDELVDNLLDRRVLFRINADGEYLYRTRSAETVRLIARLRQLFPGKPWVSAPTLVADYRYAVRARVYPKRNQSVAATLGAVREVVGAASFAYAAAEALLSGSGRSEGFRLAQFQVRATTRVLRGLRAGNVTTGTVVATGTGTGKTLAFYLPAISFVAELIDRAAWTKVVALYPRNELLKDQFAETFDEARRLDQLLQSRGRRKITLGAYFGPTPFSANENDPVLRDVWTERGGPLFGRIICPFLSCPVAGCTGRLEWRRDDLKVRRERLCCTQHNCRHEIGPDELALTRMSMRKTPPDVLFTTTESLNRNLSNSESGHIFGVGVSERPRLILLDEIHTYSGTSGAQVALLMRRWRHALGWNAYIQFVGLSATLLNAGQFFAELIGLRPHLVEEVGPGQDVDYIGHEYLLALRGDPVSATSLLSTTIQTSMLLRRMLDPGRGDASGISGGLYGRRAFVFTDDLDVTNRLYHNLLDAEGRDGTKRPIIGRDPLAALRALDADNDHAGRQRIGQSWHASELVGFDLRAKLEIDRVSSQDPGLAAGADLVVATASLEVGYNDPGVGAVIQHKAPRDVASFLQRKGRAGRSPTMRPWTVVILSDYGRDRAAYQGYDQLFDPILEARSLPISNRYVLRMQAVFSFMDWVRQQIPASFPKGAIWRDFAGPPLGNDRWNADIRQRQQFVVTLIQRLLADDSSLRDQLAEHLRRALNIDQVIVRSLLWDRPRALITSVLPTLLRRLDSGWSRYPMTPGELELDNFVRDHPLPEFVPRQLFSDLKLPEVLVIPDSSDQRGAMPVVQAMKSLAPGKVTRRFAAHRSGQSHWIAPPVTNVPTQAMSVQGICAEFEELSPCQIWSEDGQVRSMRLLRPWQLRASEVPFQILPTSNAFLSWRSQIAPGGPGLTFSPPRGSPWGAVIASVDFHVHMHGGYAHVRRFSTGSRAVIRFRNGSEQQTDIRFVDPLSESGAPAAIGFEEECDGLMIGYRPPPNFALDDINSAKMRGLRAAYFRDCVVEDAELGGLANSFQCGWLCQVYLSALTAVAAIEGLSLAEASACLVERGVGAAMSQAMQTIFQVLPVHQADDGTDLGTDEATGEFDVEAGDNNFVGSVNNDGLNVNGTPAPQDVVLRQRVHLVLENLCSNSAVTQRLAQLAPVLWATAPDGDFIAWVARRFKATLGKAILSACQLIAPQFVGDDLLLDLDAGPRPPGARPPIDGLEEIWITESTPGGAGIVEQLVEHYADDPRRFFSLIESALGPSDAELVDAELVRLLKLATDASDSLADRIDDVRTATGNERRFQAHRALLAEMSARGMIPSHPVIAAMQARILRPGSSRNTDALLLDMVSKWKGMEESLGIEIDARVFAHVAGLDNGIVDRLVETIGGARIGDNWAFNTIYGLLWPRGTAVRSHALRGYNPFADDREADRHVVLEVVRPAGDVVVLTSPNWREQVTQSLVHQGTVRIITDGGRASELKSALLGLLSQPVEIDFLNLYPQLHSIERNVEGFAAVLRLREAVQ